MNIQVNSIQDITLIENTYFNSKKPIFYAEIDQPLWTRSTAIENAGVESATPNPATRITQASMYSRNTPASVCTPWDTVQYWSSTGGGSRDVEEIKQEPNSPELPCLQSTQ